MSQVSGSQVSLCNPILHSQIQLIKTQTEGGIRWRRLRKDVRQSGTDHSGVQAGEEESRAPTEVGDLVTMSLWNALDQAMQAWRQGAIASGKSSGLG